MQMIRSPKSPAALNSSKYAVEEHNGIRYYSHRWKAGIKTKNKSGGRKSKTVIDHKDNDTKDNKRSNLRTMTRGANVGKANKLRKKG